MESTLAVLILLVCSIETFLLAFIFLWRYWLFQRFEMLVGCSIFLSTALRCLVTIVEVNQEEATSSIFVLIWFLSAWTSGSALMLAQIFFMSGYQQTPFYMKARLIGTLFWIIYSMVALIIFIDPSFQSAYSVGLVIFALIHIGILVFLSRKRKGKFILPEEKIGRILAVLGASTWVLSEGGIYLFYLVFEPKITRDWEIIFQYAPLIFGLVLIFVAIPSFIARSYSSFFGRLNLGAFVIDEDLRILEVNNHFQSLFGTDKRDFIGRSMNEILLPEIRQQATLKAKKVFETDQSELLPFVKAKWPQNTKIRTFSVHFIPISYFLTQEVSEVVGIIMDISETVSRMEELERMQSSFIASVSHELRTPLTVIKGYIELLSMEKIKDKSTNKKALNALTRNIERLEHLVGSVLTISTLESRTQLELQTIDIQNVLLHVIEEAQTLTAQSRFIELHIPKLDEPFLVKGSLEEIYQLIWTLLDNAIKFTSDQGEIIIVLQKSEENVIFQVKDNGVGIHRKDLMNIFDRFYTGGVPITSRGVGLGLTIADKIIKHLGGNITAESAGSGKGATFTVELPLFKQN